MGQISKLSKGIETFVTQKVLPSVLEKNKGNLEKTIQNFNADIAAIEREIENSFSEVDKLTLQQALMTSCLTLELLKIENRVQKDRENREFLKFS